MRRNENTRKADGHDGIDPPHAELFDLKGEGGTVPSLSSPRVFLRPPHHALVEDMGTSSLFSLRFLANGKGNRNTRRQTAEGEGTRVPLWTSKMRDRKIPQTSEGANVRSEGPTKQMQSGKQNTTPSPIPQCPNKSKEKKNRNKETPSDCARRMRKNRKMLRHCSTRHQ